MHALPYPRSIGRLDGADGIELRQKLRLEATAGKKRGLLGCLILEGFWFFGRAVLHNFQPL